MENEKLIQPILLQRYDYCPRCGQHSIELFDYNNYKLNYTKAVLQYMQTGNPYNSYLDKRNIYRMRCKGCGKVYQIKWQNNFPMPVMDNPTDRSINIFLKCYNEVGSKK